MELGIPHAGYQHMLEAFFEQPLTAFYVIQHGRFVFVTPGFLAIVGRPRDEVIGRDPLDFVMPDDRELVRGNMMGRLTGDQSGSRYVFRIRHGQGHAITVEVFARVITVDGHPAITGVLIDVTEKMEWQRRLEESEATLRDVFADLTDVIFRIDPDGCWRLLNPAWEAVTGFPMADAIGRPLADFVHPDDRGGHQAAFAALLRREADVCRHTARYRTRDGGYRWMAVNARLAAGPDGGVLGATGTLHDVSDLIEAEAKLSESRQRLQDITAVIADGVFAVDAEGRFQFLNPAAESLLGWRQEEVMNALAHPIIHHSRADGTPFPADHDPVVQSLRSRTPVRSDEGCFVRKDGTFLPVSCSVAPILRDGTVRGAVAAFHDISDQLRAQKALHDSEEQIRTVFEQSPVPLFVTRLRDHRILQVNSRSEELTRLPRSELLGRFAPDFWQDPDDRARLIQAVERDGCARDVEAVFKPENGPPLTVVISATRTVFDGEAALIIGVNDISDRKRAEDSVRESEHKLRLLTENMTDVVWSVDSGLRYTYISPSIERSRGLKPEALVGHHILEGLTPDSYALARKLIDDACDAAHEAAGKAGNGGHAESTAVLRMELQHPRNDGSVADSEVCATLVFDGGGRLIGIHGVTRDIGERKRLQMELHRRATTDDLTGLANRREFLARLTSEMERARRYGRPLTVGMLDLDHFKTVNDTHGHAAGDAALRLFAATCRTTLRRSDVIGRVGGEEFAMFLPETGEVEAVHMAERLRQAVATMPVPCDSGAFTMTVSVGLVEIHGDDTPSRALSKADQALYQAKETGRNRTSVWTGADGPVMSGAEAEA